MDGDDCGEERNRTEKGNCMPWVPPPLRSCRQKLGISKGGQGCGIELRGNQSKAERADYEKDKE